MQHPLAVVLAAFASTAVALAQSPCLPQGITVNASGGRLGDAWHVDVNGSPSVAGFFGLDLSPGPTPTPVGTVCLGLTPALQVLPFVFDPAGNAMFSGLMPPTPAFAGIAVHTAAISFDPAQPGGFGLSNGDSFTLRESRFWFVNPGTASPFGTTPGAIAALRAISGTVAFSQPLATTVRDATTVRERGWLVLLQGNSTVVAHDGASATPVLNVTLTGTAVGANKVLAMPDGNKLILLASGTAPSPFGGGTPGSVHSMALPSGAITSIPLLTGNPDAMILVPGTTFMFMRLANGVVPFDSAGGTLLPVIPLPTGFGGLVDWQWAGSQLYVLHGGQAAGLFGGGLPAAISVVDLGSLSVLSTNQLTMPAPVQMLRAGPGSTGPALYVYGTLAAALGEFAQGTVAPVATIFVGASIAAMELSALGSQWLLLCTGLGCGGPALLQLAPGTTTITTLWAMPGMPQAALAVAPSVGYGLGCIALGTNVAFPFGTDPFAPMLTATLPISWSAFRIVSD